MKCGGFAGSAGALAGQRPDGRSGTDTGASSRDYSPPSSRSNTFSSPPLPPRRRDDSRGARSISGLAPRASPSASLRTALPSLGGSAQVTDVAQLRGAVEPKEKVDGTLLRSGGTRKNESGRTVIYFVRQNPAQVSEEYNERVRAMSSEQISDLINGRAPGPIPASRKSTSFEKMSERGALNKSYPSVKALKSSPDGQGVIIDALSLSPYMGITRLPGSAESGGEKLHKMGLVYEQRPRSDDTYEFFEKRLLASKRDEVIENSNSKDSLPTFEIELYEFSYGKKLSPAAAIPPEVGDIKFHAGSDNGIQDIGSAGKTEKVATVKVHELDPDFWLVRGAGRPSGGKRKLFVYAHGSALSQKELSLQKNLALSFYSPYNSVAVAPLHLLRLQVFGPLSRHSKDSRGHHVVEVFSKNEKKPEKDSFLKKLSVNPEKDELFKLHSGSSKRGKVRDLLLSKLHSDPYGKVFDHQKELAAWVAKDGVDVLLCKKNGMGQLSDVMALLNKKNMSGDYSEISVSACRLNVNEKKIWQEKFPTYGVAMNLPAGSEPEFSF